MSLTYVSIGMGLKVSRPKITLKMRTVGFVTSGCERNRKIRQGLHQVCSHEEWECDKRERW